MRTVAIAEGPRRLLERVGAWEELAPKTQAILSMAIMDGRARDAVRLPHLNFEATKSGPLAYMAFDDDVVSTLSALADRLGVERFSAAVTRWRSGARVAALGLSGGGEIHARLAVAADGGAQGSPPWLGFKRSAGTTTRPASSPPSPMSAIIRVARNSTSCPPARSRSCPCQDGGRASSGTSGAPTRGRYLALDAEDLTRQLESRFTPKLGMISLASRVEAFPFRFQIARRFVADRLALIGDAAHVVHPIAGQGLNLGLRDVAALAETIVGEMRLGLDPGAPGPLASYQRARRFDVAASGLGMDALNRLFSNDLGPLRLVRDLGLRIVDRTPALKTTVDRGSGRSRSAPLQGCFGASPCERAAGLESAHPGGPGARPHRRAGARS